MSRKDIVFGGLIAVAMQNAATRSRLAAATSGFDTAGNAQGRAIYGVSGEAQLWGKPIPITWGKRRILGQMLQIGVQQQTTTVTEKPKATANTDNSFLFGEAMIVGTVFSGAVGVVSNVTIEAKTQWISTFAYCFGAPGNQDAKQLLVKLWFNKQLVYDIDQGALSPSIKFKFYEGTETQTADIKLNEVRYTHPVAYRGLMYVVFYDYTVEGGSVVPGNPMVEAEFVEQASNAMTTYTFGTFEDITISFGINSIFYDAKKGYIYSVGGDDQIYKFRISDRRLTDVYPISGYTINGGSIDTGLFGNAWAYFRANGQGYFCATLTPSNSRQFFVFNADTGVMADSIGVNSGSLSPSSTSILATKSASAFSTVNEVGQQVGIITSTDLFNNRYVFSFDGVTISLISINEDGANDGAVSSRFDNILHTFEWNGAALLMDGAAFYTAPNAISFVVVSPLDSTVVVASKGAPDWNIVKLRVDASVIYSYDETTHPDCDVPTGVGNLWQNQSYTGNQQIVWLAPGGYMALNLLSGVLEALGVVGPGPSPGNFFYDAYSNSVFYAAQGGGGPGTITIGQKKLRAFTTDNILLGDFLRSLAERQGYASGNITVTGINDEIIGAAITQVSDLDAMIDDLRVAYNFEVIKRGNFITFTRRTYGSGFSPDATITVADRALLNEGSDDTYDTVETNIAPAQATPGTIRINYIDPEYDYNVNEFTHKRNANDVDPTEELKLELPIIMLSSDAAALAARVLLNAGMNGVTHDFRLPQKYIALEPGDVIDLVFDDYTDTIRLTEVAYNGDLSSSVSAEAILTDVGPTFQVVPQVLPAPSPPLLQGAAEPLLIDTTLIKPSDQISANVLEVYVGAVPAERLPVVAPNILMKAVDGQSYRAAGSINTSLTYGIAFDALSDGPVLTLLHDATFRFRMVQGDGNDFTTDTVLNMLAGSNRILVGATSRWEQLGFVEAVFNEDTQEVTLTGVVRGLRGTEMCAGTHRLGDYVILVNSTSYIETNDSAVNLYDVVQYAISDGLGRVNYADAVLSQVLGMARRPWAPYNVHVLDDGGDCVISWRRRTRLSGPLLDLTPTVPLDEASEEYKLVLYRAGTVVRTVEKLAAPVYNYTTVQQAADGWSGDIISLRLEVAQVSALVGPGFVKAGTYDVE